MGARISDGVCLSEAKSAFDNNVSQTTADTAFLCSSFYIVSHSISSDDLYNAADSTSNVPYLAHVGNGPTAVGHFYSALA